MFGLEYDRGFKQEIEASAPGPIAPDPKDSRCTLGLACGA
jgi:hypothetical protein